MNSLFMRSISRIPLRALPFSMLAVICLGQNVLTHECKEKDYVCRYNNYMRIVFAKCVKSKVYDYDCSVAEQTKIVEANPDDVAAYIYRGIIYSAKDPDRAIADFNKVLELDQLYAPAYTSLASAFRKKGQHDWALAMLDRGIELFPEKAGIYASRGYVYLKLRDHGKALADFDTVIALEPDSDSGYIGRADVYSDLKDFDRALAEYDKAIGAYPRDWRSYYYRGFVYWRRGEKVKAEADCQKANEIRRLSSRFEFIIPPDRISDEYCPL